MEYLEGGNVRSLLESQGRLPVEQAVSIAADVCEVSRQPTPEGLCTETSS